MTGQLGQTPRLLLAEVGHRKSLSNCEDSFSIPHDSDRGLESLEVVARRQP